ncbi:hypothetical protein BaRGS_00037156 [Batillaria attramentaria]|uniref:Peroxidase n=1 Tax=Batillaria attramentaria TaxID=370345 RepID=A0ABD0J9V1_9CAEN
MEVSCSDVVNTARGVSLKRLTGQYWVENRGITHDGCREILSYTEERSSGLLPVRTMCPQVHVKPPSRRLRDPCGILGDTGR